ncbi:LytR/AlgR family response regulator transcription factor [Brevibacillus sp. NRS-1366]|uniref:LytR/AlgR family response regulator transcription factor n=1 Tax=Brevibacillus sp. NRS-1366 TaxID=3233899 RepID=UPI003D24BE28
MELNILIVEDQFEIRKLLATYVRHLPFVKTVYTAKNSDEMFTKLSEEESINALILDLDLGKESLDGLTAYNLCREFGYDLPAIVVTGEKLLAAHSYTIGITDVVTKAIDFKRFKMALEKLKSYYQYKRFIDNDGSCIPICGTESHVTFPSEIMYVSSEKGKVSVHTTERKKPYATDLRLNVYASLLEGYNFIYVHRSFLVNLDKVQDVRENEIIMMNGDVLPISEDKIGYVRRVTVNKLSIKKHRSSQGVFGNLMSFVNNL